MKPHSEDISLLQSAANINMIKSPMNLSGRSVVTTSAQDMAKNSVLSKIIFEIDHSIVDPPKPPISTISPEMVGSDQNYLLAIIIGVIAIAIVSVLVVLKQKSKVPQKN